MDPLRPVRGGDRVRMSAATQNAVLAAARAANNRNFGSAEGAERGDAQVMIRAAAALARFAPFALGAVVTTPAENSQFQRLPIFASAAVAEDAPFGIMLDPVAAGAMGRGLLVGMAPALVAIAGEDHEFVKINASLALESATAGYAKIIWKAGTTGNQWCLLAMPAAAGGGAAENPGANVDTIGDDSEGSETASTATWTAGGTNGLAEWYVSRVVYNQLAAVPKLYAFLRLRTYDSAGRLYSISAETRVELVSTVIIGGG